MVEHNFKIGDKVKLRPIYIKSYKQGTKIGEVIEFTNKYIRVKYKGRGYGFPYLPEEIESAVKVGEQLMFLFMKED